jgi:trimeric autotransporter adhesin
MTSHSLHRVRALSALVAATLVAACGGGGSDAPTPPPPPPPPPPPAVATISGKAVDGALQGAIACYDLNDNRACDDGEPSSAASDADGNFSIPNVPVSETGKHRVIVNVPATAIDKDTGAAVGTAFTLVAPATGTSGAQSVFVSPLTTLVQQQMDLTGQTAVQSNEFLQAQLGLAGAPLSDFTAAANADNARMANAAKLVLQTSLQQATAVAAAVGQTDVSGAVITQTDLNRAVQALVIGALPSIGAAAADPAVAALTGAAREQALTAAASTVVAQLGFTPDKAKFDIGLPKLPPPTASATPTANANLPVLQYTDAAHWFLRYNAGTVADNTPDAAGLIRGYSVRTSMAPYAYQPNDGVATSAVRTFNPELHWSGSAWTDCQLGDRDINTPRDAIGRASFDSCKSHELGYSQRGEIDIAGQTLASVWANRIAPEVAKTTNPAAWSLSPAGVALLGTATFPAGSRLYLQSNTTTQTAPTYNTIASNRVTAFSVAVAQGGDARSGGTPACAQSPTAALVTTLEQVVERNLGVPCIFNVGTDASGTSLDPNEAWGMTTTSLGTLATDVARPAGTGNYFTTSRFLRASFPGGSNTTYWSCLQRTNGGGTRNCTQIGSGTYTIATLGDARTMSFNNLPASAQALGSTRVFVERGGAVYFGYKNRVGATSTSVRLNLPAANAMLSQLALPIIAPTDAPSGLTGAKATTMAAAKGVWGAADDTSALVIRFGDNGEFLLAEVDPPNGLGRPGYEYGWFDLDPATQTNGAMLAIDTNGGWGTSHATANDGIASITDTALTTKGGETFSRLTDAGTGLVGMWALGSATDLKVTHLVYFANGKRLSIHPAADQGPCVAARQGPPGIEWSDYTFDAATGAVRVFNKIYDTSGCTGLFDSSAAVPNTEANAVITMAADQQTFTFTVPVDGGGTVTVTAYRIAPNP